ncbi:hypothetical protein [Spirosoma utsteinense]|uniref:hypothetical protein n=1 Tax=Spirosoma utsteinense TaxID=2585773 RepID=UPI001646FFD2|nr:hypothetical protein [Spirosoma utsteinense]MBC3785722.1 hypothetical protein [Spirosoma utsteinense]
MANQQGTFNLDGVATTGYAERNLTTYPKTTQGNAAWKAMLESSSRTVAVTITSGPRTGETLAALTQPGAAEGTFTGRTTFGSLPSTDTRVMNLQWVVENGYIRVTQDLSTLTENGRTIKYMVAGRYLDSIVGVLHHAATPMHVSKFYVDLNRQQRLWRGNPTTNAFQII